MSIYDLDKEKINREEKVKLKDKNIGFKYLLKGDILLQERIETKI